MTARRSWQARGNAGGGNPGGANSDGGGAAAAAGGGPQGAAPPPPAPPAPAAAAAATTNTQAASSSTAAAAAAAQGQQQQEEPAAAAAAAGASVAAGTPEGSEATGPAASSSTSGSTGASSKGRRAGSSAGAGTGSGTGVAPADASAADAKALRRLGATMESRLRALAEQEAAVKRAQAALAAQAARMASLASRLPRSADVIPLNVGGQLLATSRRTLTLVPDSLLGTMFSGHWDEHLTRDDAGRVFLDYDPALFTRLLNWLRSQDLGGPQGPLGEVTVEAGQEEQFLTLVDFLQLQRHVPCRFTETFSPAGELSSPHVGVEGATALRLGTGGRGAYAVAASSHAFFDMDVQLHLEVLRFGAVSSPRPHGGGDGSSSDDEEHGPGGLLPNNPLFVGVMARQQLAGLDQSKKRSNASWQSTCHGWWTSRRHGCEVRGGVSKELGKQVLWAQGDSLLLSIDAARSAGRPANAGPRLTLTNTRTNNRLCLDINTECLGGVYEEQWVMVVGLSGRGDEVRINSARRKGMKPHAAAEEAAEVAAAVAAASEVAAVAGSGQAAGAGASGSGSGAGGLAGGAKGAAVAGEGG